jgi:hypothetical protein
MDKFRNINYPYANQDDTFTARGLHLNMLVDEINKISEGITVDPITFLGVTDVILGQSKDIDSAVIDYKTSYPDKNIGSNADQSGTFVVNNSSEHANIPDLSWTRESTNHASGSEEIADIEFLVVSNNLVMRITNNSGNPLYFIYTIKILKYVS